MQSQAQLFRFRGPVEYAQALIPDAVEHRLMQLLFRRFRQRLSFDHQLPDTGASPGLQGAQRFVPLDGIRTLSQRRTLLNQRMNIHRQRQ